LEATAGSFSSHLPSLRNPVKQSAYIEYFLTEFGVGKFPLSVEFRLSFQSFLPATCSDAVCVKILCHMGCSHLLCHQPLLEKNKVTEDLFSTASVLKGSISFRQFCCMIVLREAISFGINLNQKHSTSTTIGFYAHHPMH
jgi:hypothetical protein